MGRRCTGRADLPGGSPRLMMKALFDTNILIDYLRGIEAARTELDRYADKTISIVIWMEVLVGTPPPLATATRDFLDSLTVIPIDTAVAERAVLLRQAHRVKPP